MTACEGCGQQHKGVNAELHCLRTKLREARADLGKARKLAAETESWAKRRPT